MPHDGPSVLLDCPVSVVAGLSLEDRDHGWDSSSPQVFENTDKFHGWCSYRESAQTTKALCINRFPFCFCLCVLFGCEFVVEATVATSGPVTLSSMSLDLGACVPSSAKQRSTDQ